MTKTLFLLAGVLFSMSAFASTPEEDYHSAVICLQNLNEAYQYQWTSGRSPSTVDPKTGDTFIVLGRDEDGKKGFVRFGQTTNPPQRCNFSLNPDHNAKRDCVKIQDANGQDIVTLKRVYPPDENKVACNPNNVDSTTKFLYPVDGKCADISYKDLGSILQKQIATNTEKMILSGISMKAIGADNRKACKKIHDALRAKYAAGVGDDYDTVINYAKQRAKDKKAKAGAAPVSAPGKSDLSPFTPNRQ